MINKTKTSFINVSRSGKAYDGGIVNIKVDLKFQ